jgi:hypothetical protein
MLRLQTNEGWWLVTHPEHARLAGEFASHWGNDLFAAPEPRTHVLHGVYAHDDGWAARDAKPQITAQGKPAAFSTELVGAYAAFEEIDLAAYLTVRREAVQLVALRDAYAAVLISMHTHNLLTERADRSTIRAEQLPWLDAFLVEQMTLQRLLRERMTEEAKLPPQHLSAEALYRNFQLLQACDNLSLLSCVDFAGEATLLHPFTLSDGTRSEVRVQRTGERSLRLTPYPLDGPEILLKLKARFLPQLVFESDDELQRLFDAASLEELEVVVRA